MFLTKQETGNPVGDTEQFDIIVGRMPLPGGLYQWRVWVALRDLAGALHENVIALIEAHANADHEDALHDLYRLAVREGEDMQKRSLIVPLCVHVLAQDQIRERYQILMQGTAYTETGRFADFSDDFEKDSFDVVVEQKLVKQLL